MKIIKIVAIIGIFISSSAGALEESVLNTEFSSYEKSLDSLTAAHRKGIEGLPKDKKAAQFILSIYGDFMGYAQISKTWSYIAEAKRQGELDPFELELEKWLLKWGRKSVLTLLVMYPNLSENGKEEVDLFVDKIVPSWGGVKVIQSDRKLMNLVKKWSMYTSADSELQLGRYFVRKVLFKEGMNNVGIGQPDLFQLTVVDGWRLYASEGKLAIVDGGVFDGISKVERIAVKKWKDVASTKGFGLQSIIWQNGSNEGGVQILRESKKDGGKEIYFLFYEGDTPPSPSKFLKDLNSDDEKVFVIRARSALRNSLRGDEKYSSGELVCRYSSRVSLSRLLDFLKDDKLAINELEVFALLHANEIHEGVFKDYPDLEKIVLKYR